MTNDDDRYVVEARHALGDVILDRAPTLTTRLGRMTADDLHALHQHAARLSQVARLEWLNRTTTPRTETDD